MPNPTIRPAVWPLAPFAPDSAVDLVGLQNEPNTCTLVVSASSSRVPISLNGANQVEIYNAGPNDCFVAFGDVTIVATVPSGSTGSYPIGSGQCKIITLNQQPPYITNVAAICAGAGAATIYASPGVGAS